MVFFIPFYNNSPRYIIQVFYIHRSQSVESSLDDGTVVLPGVGVKEENVWTSPEGRARRLQRALVLDVTARARSLRFIV